jgi:phosphatidylglycerol---prolipoprotein diacylglyceryl transferase
VPLLLADAYVHAIDPIAVQIGPLAVRWYGLSYLAGFAVAWLLVWWLAMSRRVLITPQSVPDLLFYAIIGVLVGGRLGEVLFYSPHLLTEFTRDFPWWGVLAIHRGGMASHGGIIGAALALILFAHRFNLPKLHVLDVGCVVCPPGLFFGRIANFVNAELWGRAVPDQASPPSWSVKYPQEIHRWDGGQLRELTDVVEHLNVTRGEWFTALATIERDDSFEFVRLTLDRLISAVREGNEAVIEAMRPLLTAHYPSQIFQAMSDGPALLAVLALVWLRPRKPGVIGGTFLIAYGLMRIITELFRDPETELMLGVITRGQALSALMVAAGIALVSVCARRDAPRLGGLLR